MGVATPHSKRGLEMVSTTPIVGFGGGSSHPSSYLFIFFLTKSILLMFFFIYLFIFIYVFNIFNCFIV
jgi:hypothetical protein